MSNTFPPNSTKQLRNWRVMEALSPEGTRSRHVCGQSTAGNLGVSTSAIQEFDPIAMTVKTRSGKIYTLIGASGDSSLGKAAWHKWCIDNGISKGQDVSAEYSHAAPESTITFKRLGISPDQTITQNHANISAC